MKKSPFLCLLMVLLIIFGMAFPTYAQPNDAVDYSNGCISLQAQKPLAGSEKLLESAKAVLLYELSSNTMVYSYNPDTHVDPSGMNKIMTALIALEKVDPQAVATVSRKALDSVPIGSVSAGLKRYEEIKIIDLLYCMMVSSANDAAAVIAEHVGGDQETFVAMMNQRAMELGCKNTNFSNATGISVQGQYSTARDLAVITQAALRNETFAKIFSTVNYTVAKTNKSDARELVTSNNMMRPANKDYFDARITGGKTGALSTVDRSLICTAQADGGQYLSVVMQASGTVTEDGLAAVTFGSFEETKKLLDFGYEKYGVFSLLRNDQVVERFHVSGCDSLVSVCASETLRVALPNEALLTDVEYRCVPNPELTAPIRKGQKVGTVQVWYNGICIGQSQLNAMHDSYAPGTNHVILQPHVKEKLQRNWLSVLLIAGAVLFFLIAAGGVVLLVFRLRAGHRRSLRFKQKQGSY